MRNFIVMLFTVVLLAASLQITCAAEELKGLVVYFNFEDGAGKTVTDQSGNRQNGILEGDTDWTKGKYGKGLNFGVRTELFELFILVSLNLQRASPFVHGFVPR